MSVETDTVATLAGFRILLVEDESFIAMDLHDVLTREGAAVLGPAPTVAAAQALLAAERPDAAVLDLNLRGARSTPVARALHAAGVPFVLSTGYGPGHLDDPVLRGVPLLPKPVDAGELVRTLQALLAAR